MADRRRARCKNCGKRREDVGLISWGGYCGECGKELLIANVDGLHYHRADVLLRWRRGIAASVGAILVDDVLDSE